MNFIPKSYARQSYRNFDIWFSSSADNIDILKTKRAIFSAYTKINQMNLLNPKRRSNFCCYSNYDEGCRTLNRRIPPNMLMAPYSDTKNSLITLFSPSISKANDKKLVRHLVHEIAHCFIDEKTSSTKILGDCNKNMKIDSCTNEGLAEVISYYALGLESKLRKLPPAKDFYSKDLENLTDPNRSLAFQSATSMVFLKVKISGLKRYFDSI
jgi:hypothetical protein